MQADAYMYDIYFMIIYSLGRQHIHPTLKHKDRKMSD